MAVELVGLCCFPVSDGPIAQSRLERTPDKREVVGSIPTRPTTPNSDFGIRILD